MFMSSNVMAYALCKSNSGSISFKYKLPCPLTHATLTVFVGRLCYHFCYWSDVLKRVRARLNVRVWLKECFLLYVLVPGRVENSSIAQRLVVPATVVPPSELQDECRPLPVRHNIRQRGSDGKAREIKLNSCHLQQRGDWNERRVAVANKVSANDRHEAFGGFICLRWVFVVRTYCDRSQKWFSKCLITVQAPVGDSTSLTASQGLE